ncbi:homoserine O-acetyltransferase [Fonsecaea erecta]|uniref:Homoserine O-acetyltransferase n=1 Tax=Fonsecaea erecta TaxID=1367422 RepID=A0A178ZLS6_9EURO|nr:homoserine O-acetyltransferase [Fonsecaea erecta]OAP60356.1 homoserine O-acetyltransferase [Fonsecaea erecta]
MDVVLNAQPERNYYTNLVRNIKTAIIPTFTLESGQQLHRVPVAYSAFGTLNEEGDNVLLICHALTGSSDVEDWWKPLIGRGKAVDTSRFFVICFNSLGSPYGSASPLTTDPMTGKLYGPTFPDTTFRDDVRIQKIVLDALGVRQIASVIGGSMGGMVALEWPLCTPPGYVKTVIPISTSAYQTAWGISWNTSQIRCIQADAQYKGGYYAPHPSSQPIQGLGAARMIGMLTYRSYTSFEARFGRRKAGPKKTSQAFSRPMTSIPSPPLPAVSDDVPETAASKTEAQSFGPATIYSAQSYMQYQADKFLKRFDANCYIHLLRKMDSHDITRERTSTVSFEEHPSVKSVAAVLASCTAPALVVSIESDMLFPAEQQTLLANSLPRAKLMKLDSSDGHDGFLLEMSAMEQAISAFLRNHCADVFEAPAFDDSEGDSEDGVTNSVFGELDSGF